MAELSHDEVIEILGPVGHVIIAEIIATGITKVDLEAARARVLSDRKAHNPGPPLEPGPFAELSTFWSDRVAAAYWARLARP